MGKRAQDGFTIIETTLFLAITGLLILMIVAGTGASLNIQRYRESVESFKSLVQQQYANLASVQNGRGDNFVCDSTSTVAEDSATGEIRGQSDCVLAGKYMRIEGGDVSIYTVLATQAGSTQTEDILAMRQDYAMNVASTQVEETRLDWGSQIAWAQEDTTLDAGASPTPRNMGILFIRSPYSGQVYTFTSDSIPRKDEISQATFTDLIVGGTEAPGKQGARMVCMMSGGLFADGDMGIYISPYAAGPSSIEVRTNENPVSVEENIKC